MVVMCFVQIKKTFRTFRISNTLFVQIVLEMFNVDLAELQQKLFSIIFSQQPLGKCKIQRTISEIQKVMVVLN
jgi:hypothetical protein